MNQQTNAITVTFEHNGTVYETRVSPGLSMLALYDIEAYRKHWPSAKDSPATAALFACYVTNREHLGTLAFTDWLSNPTIDVRSDE